VGNTPQYDYDGLNHLIQQTLPDGATTIFVNDPAGDILSRQMPEGLTWNATYKTHTSLRQTEQLTQGGATTRTNNYGYNLVGQLATNIDSRGTTTTYLYDGAGRLTNAGAANGSNSVTRSYGYNNRGFMTSVLQSYPSNTNIPSTTVARVYDPYGAIATEQTVIGSATNASWTQTHDQAGRRTSLSDSVSGLSFGFNYDAAGDMTGSSFNSSTNTNATFSYNSAGILTGRNYANITNSVSLDSAGRVVTNSYKSAGATNLNENISWLANSFQSTNVITRPGSTLSTDDRYYGYDSRDHLTSENFSTGTNMAYQFDGGTAAGLGLRTIIYLSPTNATINPIYGNFARLATNYTSPSALTNNFLGTNTVVFQGFDAMGNVTNRSWGSGVSDSLTWDAFSQLTQVTRSTTGGFTWNAVYDGLGRRLQTSQTPGTGGIPFIVQSSYDPDVEFLELAVKAGLQGGSTTNYWKLYGPDISGHYGGMQGTGGLEAVYNATSSNTTTILSDTYGHTEATVNGTNLIWNTSVSDGYGALPGSAAPTALSSSNSLTNSGVLAWRGHTVDPSGLYYLGARYYAPDSGTFISPDPLGHASSMDLYQFCNGDPVNRFDADGRCASQLGQGAVADLKEANDLAGMVVNPALQAVAGAAQLVDYGINYGATKAGLDPNAVQAYTWELAGAASLLKGVSEVSTVASEGEITSLSQIAPEHFATGYGDAVFYAGRGNANMIAANASGGTTISQTVGGQALNNLVDWSSMTVAESRAVATPYSQLFAQQASGPVRAWAGGASADSVFLKTELPTLLGNPAVSKITIMDAINTSKTRIIYPNRP
jgi:RHS repeat-associated protein